mmetsp:Transcript_25771/g.62326  ORF Transcript_25771/g.62326 Transcript_25771/m.62326 type:complete len:272 (-) Transcript_25771:1019-1834(-)
MFGLPICGVMKACGRMPCCIPIIMLPPNCPIPICPIPIGMPGRRISLYGCPTACSQLGAGGPILASCSATSSQSFTILSNDSPRNPCGPTGANLADGTSNFFATPLALNDGACEPLPSTWLNAGACAPLPMPLSCPPLEKCVAGTSGCGGPRGCPPAVPGAVWPADAESPSAFFLMFASLRRISASDFSKSCFSARLPSTLAEAFCLLALKLIQPARVRSSSFGKAGSRFSALTPFISCFIGALAIAPCILVIMPLLTRCSCSISASPPLA